VEKKEEEEPEKTREFYVVSVPKMFRNVSFNEA
jgi:hypothetical protein